ncbi:MAG: hypothetical protein HY064_01975 [Bacteroidetes bacterium]|nr:hypothetical protein [Bacteroidota bacterium]
MEFDVQVKDGFSNGWTKEYNDSGRLYRQTFFVNGSIDSSRTKIFPPLPEENDSQKDNRDYQYDPNRKKYYENSNHHGFDEGQRVLYKNGKISQKGIFRDNKLLTGEERVYDANGNLVQVKLFRDGKYVGDGPIPADANK